MDFLNLRGNKFHWNCLTVMKKEVMIEYSTILNFVRSMDLSNNKLSGDIPKEITKLQALQSLNLSHNLLSGRIPKDFCQNQLSGEIPPSISTRRNSAPKLLQFFFFSLTCSLGALNARRGHLLQIGVKVKELTS